MTWLQRKCEPFRDDTAAASLCSFTKYGVLATYLHCCGVLSWKGNQRHINRLGTSCRLPTGTCTVITVFEMLGLKYIFLSPSNYIYNSVAMHPEKKKTNVGVLTQLYVANLHEMHIIGEVRAYRWGRGRLSGLCVPICIVAM